MKQKLFFAILVFSFCGSILAQNIELYNKNFPVHTNPILSSWFYAEELYTAFGTADFDKADYTNRLQEFAGCVADYPSSVKMKVYLRYFPETQEFYDELHKRVEKLFSEVQKPDADIQEIENLHTSTVDALIKFQTLESSAKEKSDASLRTLYIIFLGILIALVASFLATEYLLLSFSSKVSEQEKFSEEMFNAQEEERGRISREIHESVVQDMKYISIIAADISDEKLSEEIRERQGKCIEDLRTICYNLSPPDLNLLDLGVAVDTLCRLKKEASGIDVRCSVQQGTDFSFLNSNDALNVYRIVQEAVNNAISHSGAKLVTVFFRNSFSSDNKKNGICFFISDDGKGLEKKELDLLNSSKPLPDGELHFGTKNIRERVRILKGKLQYISISGEGTELSVFIPYYTKDRGGGVTDVPEVEGV